MTTGAPIYLVSACSSGEEFISAFRRYADRNGVIFIPIAEPLPAGRRGRFAIALTDGGVMVEGQAEVVSSARTPSVLYGRVGMTVKFISPDEPSQTILTELERARTSLKPPAPSVAPRPAEIPAEPRSKPPAPSGRIDAVNALAECVVIGDVSSLQRDSDLGTIPPPVGKTPSGPVPIQLAKSPSGPVPAPVTKTPSGPTAKPPVPPTSTMPPPFKPAAKPPLPTGERAKAASIPPAVPPLPASIAKPVTGSALTATTLGMAPIRPAASTTPAPNAPPPPAAKPLGIAPPPPVAAPAANPATAAAPATREEAVAAALKFAKAVEAAGALPDETVKGTPAGVDLVGLTHTIRGTKPATMNIAPPPPIQYPPGSDDSDEKTDLTTIPSPVDTARRTEIGVAVTPSGALVLPSAPSGRTPTEEELRATSQMAATEPTANPLDAGLVPVEQVDPLGSTQTAIRLSKMQPTIEEPSGDWTLSTNDGSMTILPRNQQATATENEAAKTGAPKGPPTGDYIIALDPSRPDGWSEPSKVEKRPEGELPPGPPVSAVASEKPLDSDSNRPSAQLEVTRDEPKIQIDPTLIEPLTPMPAENSDDDLAEPPSPMPPPPAGSTLLPLAAPPLSQEMIAQTAPQAVPIFPAFPTTPGVGPSQLTPPRLVDNSSGPTDVLPPPTTAARGDLTDGGVGFFRDSGDIPRLDTHDGTSRAVQKRKHQQLAMIGAAIGAVILLVVIVLVVMGGDDKPASPPAKPTAPTTEPTTEAAPPKTEAVAPVAPVTDDTDDVIEIEPETPAKQEVAVATAPTDCSVTITSVPAEAEVTIGADEKGPAPVTVTLPCGVATKVTLKKARYQTTTREVTPKPNGKPIKIALARTTLTMKVSSSPPGATVSLNGKTLGMTPTTVKVPAFETSTLKISKDGYATESAKVAPRTSGGAVNVTLKKTATKGSSIKKLR